MCQKIDCRTDAVAICHCVQNDYGIFAFYIDIYLIFVIIPEVGRHIGCALQGVLIIILIKIPGRTYNDYEPDKTNSLIWLYFLF